jgi:hypothetical protein
LFPLMLSAMAAVAGGVGAGAAAMVARIAATWDCKPPKLFPLKIFTLVDCGGYAKQGHLLVF